MSPAQQASEQHALRRYNANAQRLEQRRRYATDPQSVHGLCTRARVGIALGLGPRPAWLRFAEAWEDPAPALLVRAPKARVYR